MPNFVDPKIKEEIVHELSSMNKKRPADSDFEEMGKKFSVSKQQVKYYWNNFIQCFNAERRITHGKSVGKEKRAPGTYGRHFAKAKYQQPNPAAKTEDFCNTHLANILRKDKSMAEVLASSEISVSQFYKSYKELLVKGTINSFRIFDPRKYYKLSSLREICNFARSNAAAAAISRTREESLYLNIIKVMIQYLLKGAKKSKKEIAELKAVASDISASQRTVAQEILINL